MANQGSNTDQSIQDIINQQASGSRETAKLCDVVIEMDKIESDCDDQKFFTNDDNIDDQKDDKNDDAQEDDKDDGDQEDDKDDDNQEDETHDGNQEDETSKMIPACGNNSDLEDKTNKTNDSEGERKCMNW